MAIALRAAQGSQNAAGGTTITMTVPTGVQDGDVMVMIVYGNAVFPVTPLTGWTDLTGANSGSGKFYWRLASSEPASYSVATQAGSGKMSGVIIALSGADSTSPGSTQHSFKDNTSSATISAITLGTFASHNGIDLFLGGTSIGTTTGQPASYTEPTNGSATNSGGGAANTKTTTGIAYRALSGVTTVGALSAVYGAAAVNDGFHVFIFEAVQVPSIPTLQQYSQSVNRAANW